MKNNLTKKGFSLVELIASILISSVILIGFYKLTSDALLVLQTKKESVKISNELFSLKLFIQNRLFGARFLNVSQNSIDFLELDHLASESQIYSGFAELDNNETTKIKIKTKCVNYLPQYPIYAVFENSYYEVESVNSNEIVFAEKAVEKKFSENYTICKNSKIYFDGSSLKYDGTTLLANIKNINISHNSNLINIDFCADFDGVSICRNWDFVI